MTELSPTEQDHRRDAALGAARARCATLDPPPHELAPVDLIHAYATQKVRMHRLGARRPAAFKLGGTNVLSRNTFQCDAPFFGMLSPAELVDGLALDWSNRISPRVEPEIALAVTENLPPRAQGYGVDELEGLIAWVAPALDVGDSALACPQDAGLAWMLSDACGAGRLVLGERMGANALSEFEESFVLLMINGQIVSHGCGQAIIGGALGALREFLLVLSSLNLELPAGAPVALGGCAPSHPLPITGEVHAVFGDAGAVHIAI